MIDRVRIGQVIDRLPEGDIKRLAGKPDHFRARVGRWRVLFTVNRQQRVVNVLSIGPRGDAYKGS